jgi:hypothetical protein
MTLRKIVLRIAAALRVREVRGISGAPQRTSRRLLLSLAAGAVVAGIAVGLAGAFNADTLVTVGSPTSPFSPNKQYEPAVAMDADNPNILVAGANENIDDENCNAGDDTTCPFTDGVGTTGVYFSFDRGDTWTQPTYTGWTARNCTGAPGPDAPCAPQVGPIGTLPWFYENGLATIGDPAVSIGPRPDSQGHFGWSNGPRLYFANITGNFASTRTDAAFRGFYAIGVSRTDDLRAAAAGDKSAWCVGKQGCAPVLVSHQSSTTFSDKDQIWADNASSSKFFGNVYVCWTSYVGQEKANLPAPLQVAVSSDGGDTWSEQQISAAAGNTQHSPSDGCNVRTDSQGNAYIFSVASSPSDGKQKFELMSVSTNGGKSWSPARPVVGPVTQPGVLDPVQGALVMDGIAGTRTDLAPMPSIDIANGAPTGADATNRIVMSYVSGTVEAPHVLFTESTDLGKSWSTPRPIETTGDRGIYTAPAISPNGTDVYIVYNAFTTPFRNDTTSPRALVGVVMHADSSPSPGTATGAFTELHRGAPGDVRGASSNGLDHEFIGDFVYAAASRTYGATVWNDVSNAADCPAIDSWRASLQAGSPTATPAPDQDCPANFGNIDVRGGTYPDPTP